ncbi:hypothetical protein MPC1_9360002 [Methylocella tundrae]|nr:hypothetical protein MPC1_9360002 [Methylocella tundrae]
MENHWLLSFAAEPIIFHSSSMRHIETRAKRWGRAVWTMKLEGKQMQPWKTMVTAVALMASVAASGVAEAAAAPIANLGAIAYGDSVLPLDEAQFVWGGRRYCWYPGGWRGPGWYW